MSCAGLYKREYFLLSALFIQVIFQTIPEIAKQMWCGKRYFSMPCTMHIELHIFALYRSSNFLDTQSFQNQFLAFSLAFSWNPNILFIYILMLGNRHLVAEEVKMNDCLQWMNERQIGQWQQWGWAFYSMECNNNMRWWWWCCCCCIEVWIGWIEEQLCCSAPKEIVGPLNGCVRVCEKWLTDWWHRIHSACYFISPILLTLSSAA